MWKIGWEDVKLISTIFFRWEVKSYLTQPSLTHLISNTICLFKKTMISWLAKAFSFKNLLFFIASIDAIFESITNTSFECSVGIGITRHGRVSLHIFTFIALIKLTQLTNIFGWGLHALSSKNGSVSPSYSWLNLRLYQGSGVIRCIKFKKQFSTDITS